MPSQLGVGRARRAPSFIVACAVLAFGVQAACGSDDAKKVAGPQYHSGGDAAGGEAGQPSKGGSAAKGGEGSSNGGEGNAGGSTTTSAGQSAGGEGGTPGSQCPKGTADCDNNPDDCETDATLLTSCGACDVTCKSTNGSVICGDKGCEVTSCMAGFGDCNDTGTDGCESDLTTADNCGVCGHSCGKSACSNGLCAPTQLGSAAAAYRWTSTSDAIYRFSCDTPSYFVSSSYSLIRTPLNGGAEVVTWADSKGSGGLAVDDTYVYWAVNGTPSAVFRKAHTAAAATAPTALFETPSLPVQLRIQGTAMYWTALDGQIYTRKLGVDLADPGSVVLTAAQVKGSGTFQLHQDFVTTPTSMYWMVLPTTGTDTFIRGAKLNGTGVADVSGAITSPYSKLSTVGEDLYWVRATGAALDGAYHSAKGGAAEGLVIQAGLAAEQVSGDYLYLLDGDLKVYRAPIAGGASVQIGSGAGLATINDFAGASADNVYALTAFTHGAGFYPPNKMLAFPR